MQEAGAGGRRRRQAQEADDPYDRQDFLYEGRLHLTNARLHSSHSLNYPSCDVPKFSKVADDPVARF